MRYFKLVDRPPRNRRSITDKDMEWDEDLETALLGTLTNGKAILIDLGLFHSSPAKGRLWKNGYKVHHRVNDDRETVAAWLERDEPPDAPEEPKPLPPPIIQPDLFK
jgi:hypothetical protein